MNAFSYTYGNRLPKEWGERARGPGKHILPAPLSCASADGLRRRRQSRHGITAQSPTAQIRLERTSRLPVAAAIRKTTTEAGSQEDAVVFPIFTSCTAMRSSTSPLLC